MPCRFLESVDRRDVGMIQRGEGLRLPFEPRETLGVPGERVRQDLDGDLTTQRRVRRPVHLPHSAFADRRSDFVDAEARAGGQGQLCREYKGRTGRRTRLLSSAGRVTPIQQPSILVILSLVDLGARTAHHVTWLRHDGVDVTAIGANREAEHHGCKW